MARFPAWIKAKFGHAVTEPNGRKWVTVTITANVSKYVEAMGGAVEGARVAQHRRRIASERALGLASVDRLLHDMAERYGLSQDARFLTVDEFRRFRSNGSPGGAIWPKPLTYDTTHPATADKGEHAPNEESSDG